MPAERAGCGDAAGMPGERPAIFVQAAGLGFGDTRGEGCLKTPDSLDLASDEGDIACIRENRETAWFSIPAKPAAMMREGSRLMVLDDGAKNGGIPRVYRFSL